MAYSREIYDSAIKRLTERRARALEDLDEKKTAFFALYPRAAEIEAALSKTAAAAAKAVLTGGNVARQLTRLKESNLSLQEEYHDILQSAGLPDDYLTPKFQCVICRDTGYVDGKMCSCLKDLLKKEAYRRLNAMTPLSLSTFQTFSLKYYPEVSSKEGGVPPKKQMERVFLFCRDYAEHFSLSSQNLIMQGGTGLGKTHLSLAIANEALEKGFGVIYGSAQNLATNLERERFSREPVESDTNQMLLSCDLLILDDLGTEFSTSFVDAAIYNVINTRLMTENPTIISTNLSMLELQKRYSERFVSRVIGSYTRLLFCGKDVRQQKRQER